MTIKVEDILAFLLVWASILIVVLGMFWIATDPCQTLDAESLSENQVVVLIADGWYGDPTDHAETLYSPGCK
jgi:hypothetical protein